MVRIPGFVIIVLIMALCLAGCTTPPTSSQDPNTPVATPTLLLDKSDGNASGSLPAAESKNVTTISNGKNLMSDQNFLMNTLTLVFPYEYDEEKFLPTVLLNQSSKVTIGELGPVSVSYNFSDIVKQNSNVTLATIESFTLEQTGYNKNNLEYAFDHIINLPVSRLMRYNRVVEREETAMGHYSQIKYVFSSFEENPEFYAIHHFMKQNIDNKKGNLYHISFVVNLRNNSNYISEEEYQSIISTMNISSPHL